MTNIDGDPLSTRQTEHVRLATGRDRSKAAKLLRQCYNIDLSIHEKQSGAEVSLLAWPASGKVQAAAALVLYRDGTSFIHPPAGNRTQAAVTSLYHAVRHRAQELRANVALILLPPQLAELQGELRAFGFKFVGDVMTMQSADRARALSLARLPVPPVELGLSEPETTRLATLIQATYAGSLSDPSLGPEHNAHGFLDRLKSESPDHQDRFVLALNGQDAAVCLLSRYDAHAYIAVRYLGVTPAFRGRGLGRQLLATSLARLWSDRYRYCLVDVDRGNTYAVAVYSELGFRIKSQATEFLLPLE